MKRLIYSTIFLALPIMAFIWGVNNSLACDRAFGDLKCTSDLSDCLDGVFYPCGNNASWIFKFCLTGDGPRNTSMQFKLESTGIARQVNSSSYPSGAHCYEIQGGPDQMIQNWERLWIIRWLGSGGDFINMDLQTTYTTGDPTRPEGP